MEAMENLKRALEEWLECPWTEALLELAGGLLFFSSLIVLIIFIMAIA
jgi:hypothetical protein